jgi:hypothetical protein
MNKTPRYSWNLVLALSLALSSGVVLAKDARTHAARTQPWVEYQCSPTAESTGATAKSPQGNDSYSCTPITSLNTATPVGATTAKSPSSSESRLLTHGNVTGDRCTAEC